MNLESIQRELEKARLDGWLFFDHHERDPLAYRVLGLKPSQVTRRWYYFIPARGEPRGLTHQVEPHVLDGLPGTKISYKIHSAWTNGGTYFAPPTMGTLADVDPALLVTPPMGMEVGYVPIATSEAWGGWVAYSWTQATSGNWSGGTNWVSASAPAAGGHSYYRFTFTPPGSYVVTNDLSSGNGYGGYAVNQLSFAGAVTLTGNPITLTADVGSLPQINQNSSNGVVINTRLNLDVSTVLGGTGSGLVVISNAISGSWHKLTVNSPGTWRVCGLTPNTYSGGTIINRGTVIWGIATDGTSPECSYALAEVYKLASKSANLGLGDI